LEVIFLYLSAFPSPHFFAPHSVMLNISKIVSWINLRPSWEVNWFFVPFIVDYGIVETETDKREKTKAIWNELKVFLFQDNLLKVWKWVICPGEQFHSVLYLHLFTFCHLVMKNFRIIWFPVGISPPARNCGFLNFQIFPFPNFTGFLNGLIFPPV
jgi:hypothetical protein